jgi:hypothetical protein
LEGKGDNKKKKVMRGEVSYSEARRSDGSGRKTALEDIDSDSREEWTVVRSKKERRNERPIGDKARRETIANEDRIGKIKRMCNRSEAILAR